jgi:hypothetical protein
MSELLIDETHPSGLVMQYHPTLLTQPGEELLRGSPLLPIQLLSLTVNAIAKPKQQYFFLELGDNTNLL